MIIIVNVKAYAESIGSKLISLVDACSKVRKDTGTDIRIAVPLTEISKAVNRGVPILAQHIDPIAPGKHTGYVTAEMIKLAGASGTLLNHSEHRLRLDVLEESITRCHMVGLQVVACANDALTGAAIGKLKPDLIAIEPPELIGGKISVSTAHPELISDSVKLITGKKVGRNVLVGAGVHTRADVLKAFELGAGGVLVASGVVLAKDPERALRELATDAR
ncbi:MAG: triose-phosphate isomerase [Candidatus Woesearchaeota archaeon]